MSDHPTSVRYLRNLAEEFGGIRGTRGQALHRAASHLIRQQEELQRLTSLLEATGEARVDAAARGIYLRTAEFGAGELTAEQLPTFDQLPPASRERFRVFARAALGEPVVEDAADDADLRS